MSQTLEDLIKWCERHTNHRIQQKLEPPSKLVINNINFEARLEATRYYLHGMISKKFQS